MEIVFNSGGIYRFENVPETVFVGLARSDSKGKFFHRHVRGRYRHQRLGRHSARRRGANAGPRRRAAALST